MGEVWGINVSADRALNKRILLGVGEREGKGNEVELSQWIKVSLRPLPQQGGLGEGAGVVF